MKRKVDILMIEDSKSYAQGMELLLKQNTSVAEVFYASDYSSALDALKERNIDIVILDLNFETEEYDGFIIANKIKQQYPIIKIIVLSQHIRKQHYKRLIEEELVDAYLDKQLGIEETYIALETVLKGHSYVDSNIYNMLEIETWMHLSLREREVVELLCEGITQKEVANNLCISPKTVETHIRNLFERFKVKNTTELVAKYMKYKNANRENIEGTIPPFKK